MKERFILAPKINESEFLRTLAKYGINSIGTRIVDATTLAKTALIHSGVSINFKLISSEEEKYILYEIAKTINYFKTIRIQDAQNLVESIKTLRNWTVDDDEKNSIKNSLSKGKFINKNNALFDLYSKFVEWMSNNKVMNTESLIRYAINNAEYIDSEFIVIKELSYTPLQISLVNKISNCKIKHIKITDLFNHTSFKNNDTYIQSYGKTKEIENIIYYIYSNNIPIDKCLIVCSNPNNYAQAIYQLIKQNKIKSTFSFGLPIINSFPAKLLKILNDWKIYGECGIDAWRNILNSEAFNLTKFEENISADTKLSYYEIERICEIAGSLRISYNKSTNQERIINYENLLKDEIETAQNNQNRNLNILKNKLDALNIVKFLAQDIETGVIEFIDKYSVIRNNEDSKIDTAAKEKIFTSINIFSKYFPKKPMSEIIPYILQENICHEISKEGHLHITNIENSVSCIREYVFICGLSANEFPGSPNENSLILDEDLKNLSQLKNIPTSNNIIQTKINDFFNVVNVSKNLGSNIILSYSSYNLAGLKEQNPSSVLLENFDKYSDKKGIEEFQNNITKLKYYENNISSSNLIIKEYTLNKKAIIKQQIINNNPKTDLLSNYWSPSAVECYFNCPRQFYLKYLLKLDTPEESNPYEIINARDIGNLSHELMETLKDNSVLEADFLKLARSKFDDYLITKPPITKSDAIRERNNFINIMKTAYRSNPFNFIVASEKKFLTTHNSGINLKGYVDRIEKLNGEYILVDFKTKKNIDHIANDINTCLQIIMYAYMCENNNINITKCEYRYLRFGLSIESTYNDEIRTQLNEKLNIFKDALIRNEFLPADNVKNCKNCSYKIYCKTLNNKESIKDE